MTFHVEPSHPLPQAMRERELRWLHRASTKNGGLVGSPETIRRKLRKFEQSHVDQVIL
jgi:hypothetical protein